MPALLLSHRDLVVTLEDEHLVLRRKTQPAQAPLCVPLRAISRVDILGEPAISFAALSAIIRHAIPCHILSTSGRWRAMIDTASDTMAKRRSVQYQRTNERSFNLQVARQLLMAKVRNQRRVVQRLRAARPALAQSETLALQERTLSWAMARLKMAQDATALRGAEGAAARAYFATFPAFLPEAFPFAGRHQHPATDPFNALLSFSYTRLMAALLVLLKTHGLDPALGVLHQNGNRMPALALDLIEPFRPAADLFCFNLVNHRILRAEAHFERTDSQAVLLNEAGRPLYFQHYERFLTRTFTQAGATTTLQTQLERTVLQFLETLQDPYSPKCQTQRFFVLP